MNPLIRTHPDPILYRAARPVAIDELDTELVRDVVDSLRMVMKQLAERPPAGFEGATPSGLAANQLGFPVRIFVLAQWPQPFINPEIEYVLGKPAFATERCYSLPGIELVVGRAEKVKLRHVLPNGQTRSTKMRGSDARAAQHEFDHLEGVTIVQRSEPPGEEGIPA